MSTLAASAVSSANNELVNADYEQNALMHGQKMEWKPSPHPQVLRKRLELYRSTEAGRVTSIVQYLPGSSFHSHGHPEGEEILVLEGTFQDEHGNYPAGSFLLNPDGFEHQPFSVEGCVIFVKLRQFPGRDKQHVFVDTFSPESKKNWHSLEPQASEASELVLYEQREHLYEKICLVRLPPATSIVVTALLNGLAEAEVSQLMPRSELFLAELFVVDGPGCTVLQSQGSQNSDNGDTAEDVAAISIVLDKWSWLRDTWISAQQWIVSSNEHQDQDSMLYVKIGTRDRHLRDV